MGEPTNVELAQWLRRGAPDAGAPDTHKAWCEVVAVRLAANEALVKALESLVRAYGAEDGRNGNSGECWDLAREALAKVSQP